MAEPDTCLEHCLDSNNTYTNYSCEIIPISVDPQRQNISQNVPENFDSDLKKLKVWRVENDSNPIVAGLNIKSLGEKINHLCEICKESPMDIPCVDEINRY